jgi:hypothetical protein
MLALYFYYNDLPATPAAVCILHLTLCSVDLESMYIEVAGRRRDS